jgi:hypothetical protein
MLVTGHGPIDFENLHIRIPKKGTDPRPFWSAPEPSKDVDALMQKDAYRIHTDHFSECGSFSLAGGALRGCDGRLAVDRPAHAP